jgi:hypothetical protein
MSYEQLKKLRPVEFKRYCGVKPHTFQKMAEVFSQHLQKTRRKQGRPPKLSVEDQVLMTLEYWREYRTLFHIAKSWGIAESNVSRIVRRVEDVLSQSRAFPLPGKKKLQAADHEIAFIVVDVAETPIERPKKSKKLITAARRSVTPSSRRS